MKKLIQASLAVLLSLSIASPSMAIGGANIGNEVLSARSAGQGYVGVAGQNDDPATVYSNPAAIGKLNGTQVSIGAHWENLHGEYVSDTGSKTKMRSEDLVVPNFSLTQSFMDGKLGAGLTVQSPYGVETHWPGNSTLGLVATNSRVNMVMISPAVSYQVIPMVSVGAGADYYNVFNTQLDNQMFTDPFGGDFSPNAVASLRGSGTAWSYHAGILVEPTPQHALGLTYHNKAKIRINGSESITGLSGVTAGLFGGSNYLTNGFTDLNLPSNVQLGYAYKPTEKWLLEADAAWYHWSSGRDLDVRFPNSNILGPNSVTPLTLRDVWSVATGANYKANDKWQLRGGLWYEPWAMPESTFSPAFMDLSRYGLSAGLGYAIMPNLTVDAAYTAVFFHNRTIHNAVTLGGTYKDFANLVALNFTYRFGATK